MYTYAPHPFKVIPFGVTPRKAKPPASGPPARLGQRYYLRNYEDMYFIIRDPISPGGRKDERACLYQEGVVDARMHGTDEPVTVWLTNERRYGRLLKDIQNHMEDIAHELRIKPKETKTF